MFKPLFGFYQFMPLQNRQRVIVVGNTPLFRYFDRPEEREVLLKREKEPEGFWTTGYLSDQSSEVLARFEDGTAALLGKSGGRGRVYLFGMNLDDLILRNQVNRAFDVHRSYVNGFEPGTEVWLLIFRAWYETAVTDWIRAGATPYGLGSVLMLSHTVDWDRGIRGAPQFATLEKRYGASRTFFIHTKYVSDGTSWAFFFGEDLELVRHLKAEGFELGSHAVVHPHIFHSFPVGTRKETFTTYRPYARSTEQGLGRTIFGGVQVSKELLAGRLPS
ncbi:MAG: polysaccharide deacetylase family protein [Candidatus Binatia bacterium]